MPGGKPGTRVIIEGYTLWPEDPVVIYELSVGDKFEDLSDQWSYFRIAGFVTDDPAEVPADPAGP